MSTTIRLSVNLAPVDAILRRHRLDPHGDVQRFHTQNVLRRIVKYMPYRSGATIGLTQTDSTDTAIVTQVPYARYLYYGKAMAGPPPKVVTEKDLRYTKSKNPLAGPYWDRALAAAEGAALTAELQAYVRRR